MPSALSGPCIEPIDVRSIARMLSGSDTLPRFLGPETKRFWTELEAIWKASAKVDLQDRTVLEGEVLISRICADLRQLHS